jgi:hypothetical protein
VNTPISLGRRITLVLATATLWALVICLTGWANPPVQSNKKTVIRRLTVAKYPLELAVELNGEPVKATKTVLPEQGLRTEEFAADADWLKNLTLKITNTSNRVITYVVLDLTFPETATSDNPRVGLHQIFLGIDPDRKFSRPELRMAPNESIEIPLATIYNDIKTLVASRLPIENVTKVEVEFHSALFADGTLFETGDLFRRNPDPNDPRKWIRIDH